jgi:flagellar motor switch protein FliG
LANKLAESLKKLVLKFFPFLEHSGEKKRQLSDLQKTAIFFLSLPPDATARLIGTLSSSEINTLTMEMCQMSSMAPSAQKEVLKEFYEILLEEGKLPEGAEPNREVFRHIADRDPKGVMGILRRHWLAPKFPPSVQREQKEIVERIQPEERVAVILSRLHPTMVKKILPQLTQEELMRIGHGLLELPSILDGVQQQVWNSLSRWFRGSLDDQESILKGIHHLLQEDNTGSSFPPLDYMEKGVFLIRLLKPKDKEIGKIVLELLDRNEQENFIFALRQPPHELPEREKRQIIEEFLSFVRTSFLPHEQASEETLLREIEGIGLHRPKEIAETLESYWLVRKNSVAEWRELAEKQPTFSAQKLADFMQRKGKRWETYANFEKCALILRFLHPEIRSEILKHLNEKHQDLLAYQMKRLPALDTQERRALFEEFLGQYYYYTTNKLLGKGS